MYHSAFFISGYVELESANLDRLLGSIVDKPKKRDAESLVVRAGCSLVARTEPWGKEGYSFNFQGNLNFCRWCSCSNVTKSSLPALPGGKLDT